MAPFRNLNSAPLSASVAEWQENHLFRIKLLSCNRLNKNCSEQEILLATSRLEPLIHAKNIGSDCCSMVEHTNPDLDVMCLNPVPGAAKLFLLMI